ncbi:hypothetical protein PpBr36_07780 [Pyricularia pennisetigena]|uniref:hypothetical protein n=1 Tax=Pyricularia pennisetigena TaxID=1578925 RepID=UPI0011511BBF|nr:hypothetical protein PpBr36_07780 [Pyricularia pennisetigena]TLS24961.1 hypothetical protein PpBr36_07780 [Pyricularia pennisetigena]
MVYCRSIIAAALVASVALGATTSTPSARESAQPSATAAPEPKAFGPSSECHKYHIFAVRGSSEPYPGRMGRLLQSLCQELGEEDCGYEDVQYPANSSYDGPGLFCQSASTGARNGQRQMKEYSERCQDSGLMLLGYSQGASVAGDILGGGGGFIYGCEQPENPPLNRTSRPGSKVIAAVTWGAVRHTANQTYNQGEGSSYDGILPRSGEQLEALKQYSRIYRDWCNYGDAVCAVESQKIASAEDADPLPHWNYFDGNNSDSAKEWILDTVRNGGDTSTDDEKSENDEVSSQGKPEPEDQQDSGANERRIQGTTWVALTSAVLLSVWCL